MMFQFVPHDLGKYVYKAALDLGLQIINNGVERHESLEWLLCGDPLPLPSGEVLRRFVSFDVSEAELYGMVELAFSAGLTTRDGYIRVPVQVMTISGSSISSGMMREMLRISNTWAEELLKGSLELLESGRPLTLTGYYVAPRPDNADSSSAS